MSWAVSSQVSSLLPDTHLEQSENASELQYVWRNATWLPYPVPMLLYVSPPRLIRCVEPPDSRLLGLNRMTWLSDCRAQPTHLAWTSGYHYFPDSAPTPILTVLFLKSVFASEVTGFREQEGDLFSCVVESGPCRPGQMNKRRAGGWSRGRTEK